MWQVVKKTKAKRASPRGVRPETGVEKNEGQKGDSEPETWVEKKEGRGGSEGVQTRNMG